jgi:hypothetical protein
MKPIPLSIPSLFTKAVFSKPPQELPLVALVHQEKSSFGCTRLSIAIWAKGLVLKDEMLNKFRF